MSLKMMRRLLGRRQPAIPAVALCICLSGGLILTSGAASPEERWSEDVESGRVLWREGSTVLPISMRSPRFSIDGKVVGGEQPNHGIGSDLATEGRAELDFAPIALESGGRLEVKLCLEWSESERILRKWARYRVAGAAQPVSLQDIVLDEIEVGKGLELAPNQPLFWPPMSYPVFLKGFFLGIEFPMASTRLEADRIILGHRPGLNLQPDMWHESRKAVYGCAEVGAEKSAFQAYIMSHVPGTRRPFFVFEPWCAIPIRYTQSDLLDLMRCINKNLHEPYGVAIDSLTITAGWSNPKSLWEIDPNRFPSGFHELKEMFPALGLWMSPCAFYDFALETNWLQQAGYETLPTGVPNYPRVACLAGKRYREAFKRQLVNMFRAYEINYAYFDGYASQCPETDHGHMPGEYSAEAIAEGIIEAIQAVRADNPDVWLEATCFTGNASPWWLFYVNTVLGNYGDDCPWGRIPSPVYRESQLTGRDRAHLQGCTYNIVPIACQEVFGGLVGHTDEPLVNDAVMGVMRGSMLYMMAFDPNLISQYEWASIARIVQWYRDNADIMLANTLPLLPTSWSGGNCPRLTYEPEMPREPYGYAHWNQGKAIVALRNPWITDCEYTLNLGDLSLSPDAQNLSAVSLYPENRLYAKGFKCGDSVKIPLRPYETVVLSIGDHAGIGDLPLGGEKPAEAISAHLTEQKFSKLEYEEAASWSGPDWIAIPGEAGTSTKLELGIDVVLKEPVGELLILLESQENIINPHCSVTINGQETPAVLTGPDTGYQRDGHARPENWLFLRYPLPRGESKVSVELLTRGGSPELSVWGWATRNGDVKGSTFPNSLPQPESLSVATVQILSPVRCGDASMPAVKTPRPVAQVDGLYLDALEPAEGTDFSKNTNVGGAPLSIRGRRYFRGLGIAAPSRIVFDVGGQYRRLQAWVGVDGSTATHDKSRIGFAVLADGKKVWSVDSISRWNEPLWVDVDIDKAAKVELLTTRTSEREMIENSYWGNWAEARVLR